MSCKQNCDFVTWECYYGERFQRKTFTIVTSWIQMTSAHCCHIPLSPLKMIRIVSFMLLCTCYSEATTDLNSLELRYLADHLTNEECRKLHEALKMSHFDLDHKVTGQKEAHVPCIILLQYWDKVEAKKSNFQVRSINLHCMTMRNSTFTIEFFAFSLMQNCQ